MLGLHDRGSVLRRVEIAYVIHLRHKGKGVGAQILEASRLQHARVRYENVDAAEMLHSRADHLFHGSRVRHVHLQADGPLSQALCRFLRLRVVQVCQNHAGALPVHLCGNAKAKALGAPGDNRDLARQPSCGLGSVVDVFLCVLFCFCQVHNRIPPVDSETLKLVRRSVQPSGKAHRVLDFPLISSFIIALHQHKSI